MMTEDELDEFRLDSDDDDIERDEFGLDSDDDDELVRLANAAPIAGSASQASSKRKIQTSSGQDTQPAAKRVKVFPETSDLARRVLKDTFGLDAFRLKQEAAIARLLHPDGGNAAVVFPTGGGKSLCYQVPAIAFEQLDAGNRGHGNGGITIVVSPLIALMKDQTDALRKRGVYAVAMDSTLKRDEYLQVQQDLREGKVKIIYCAPERLNNEGFVSSIKYVRGGVRLVAVDEAHCVSEWGHSFRPDYLKVARFAKEIKAERVICLTATATPAVGKDICEAFDIDKDAMFRTAMYRPNLRLLVQTTVDVQAKYPPLFAFLRANPGPTVVYATVQKQTEELADDLRKQGFPAVHYHAGETTAYKTRVQDEFLNSDNMIICATIAFGMGIDKPDIRNVVHFDMPSSIEGYSQQVGRAGRDGKPSQCLFFVCSEDYYLRDIFVYGDLPSTTSVRKFVTDVFEPNAAKQKGETFEVSHYAQGRQFDIKPTALSILYAQLELHFGLIRATTPKYSNYSFKAKAGYSTTATGDRSNAANAIRLHATQAATLHHLDVDSASRTMNVPRVEIINKLSQWSDEDYIELRTSGLQHVYKIEKQLPTTKNQRETIADTLFAQMHKREQQDLKRSQDVIELVTASSCISRGLARYFGDESLGLPPECGHCSWCETHTTLVIPPRRVVKDDSGGEKTLVGKLLQAIPDRDDPRFLARVAFGIKSPRISMLKYDRQWFFAAMREYDFPSLVRIFTKVCEDAPDVPESRHEQPTGVTTPHRGRGAGRGRRGSGVQPEGSADGLQGRQYIGRGRGRRSYNGAMNGSVRR